MRDAMSRHLVKLEGKKRDLSELLTRPWCHQKMVIRGNWLSGVKRLLFLHLASGHEDESMGNHTV